MKRTSVLSLSLMLCVAPSALAQEPVRPAAQNQVLQLIGDLYVNQFQTEVGLNEEQFLKVGGFIRQFIQMRFRAANQKQVLEQQLTQLLGQDDPSEAAVQTLSEQKAQLERNVANSENNLLTRIRPDITPRQAALVLAFNKRFFEERLPQLLERARTAAGARQPPAQQPRQNQNKARNTNPAGDAFRNR